MVAIGLSVAGATLWVTIRPRDAASSVEPAAAENSPSGDVCRDWPFFNGPTHDGVCHDPDVQTTWPAEGPRELWRVPLGAGYAAPVAQGDDLIVFYRRADQEVVACLDPRTGRPRWEFADPTAFECAVAYSSGPYSTPALDEQQVYALGADGDLFCLDRRRGTLVWRRGLGADFGWRQTGFFPPAASPLIEGELLILNVGGRQPRSGIVALDRRTGATRWTATDHGASCATARAATIHGRRLVLVWTAEALVSLAAEDGRALGQLEIHANDSEAVHASSPVIADDVVFVSGYLVGNLCARVLPDGSLHEVWRDRRRNLDSQYNNLICRDGLVYGFSSYTGSLHCIELLTGDLRWKWKSPIRRGASIAVSDRLVLFGERGRLGTVQIGGSRPQPVCMTAQPLLEGPCFSAPALHHGRLYLRNEEVLACYDLRKSAAVAPGEKE